MLEGERMKYIEDLLHVKVRYELWDKQNNLIPYITSRYDIKVAYLEHLKTLFIYPKYELDSIADVKHHFQQIKDLENIPIVLVCKKLTARQREYYIKSNVSFVVEFKQLYLPFMGMYLQNRCDKKEIKPKVLSPMTQVVFLFLIYTNIQDIELDYINKSLNLNSMAITRAVQTLESLELIQTYKRKVQKIIHLNYLGKELFEKGLKYLSNPLKQTVYVDKTYIKEEMKAGYTALSQHSMLSLPDIECYAHHNIKIHNDNMTEVLLDTNQVMLQKWSYDPRHLSNNESVDILSLYLTLLDDQDERVEGELESMMKGFWDSLKD